MAAQSRTCALPCCVLVESDAGGENSSKEDAHRLSGTIRDGSGCVAVGSTTSSEAEHEPGGGSHPEIEHQERFGLRRPARLARVEAWG